MRKISMRKIKNLLGIEVECNFAAVHAENKLEGVFGGMVQALVNNFWITVFLTTFLRKGSSTRLGNHCNSLLLLSSCMLIEIQPCQTSVTSFCITFSGMLHANRCEWFEYFVEVHLFLTFCAIIVCEVLVSTRTFTYQG